MKSVAPVRLASLVALSLVMVGCATDKGRERSGKAVSSVADTRMAVLDADKEVKQSLDAIAKLEAAPNDLLPAFNAYKTEVRDVKKQAANVRSAAADMRQRAAIYRSAWRAESETLSNEALKESAEARQKRIEERFDRVNQHYTELDAAFGPYIADLDDIQTFLSNDLTFNGVKAASPAIEKARKDGETLRAKLAEMTQVLENTKDALSPTTTPAS
jgi:chromosome segregation ATPase